MVIKVKHKDKILINTLKSLLSSIGYISRRLLDLRRWGVCVGECSSHSSPHDLEILKQFKAINIFFFEKQQVFVFHLLPIPLGF